MYAAAKKKSRRSGAGIQAWIFFLRFLFVAASEAYIIVTISHFISIKINIYERRTFPFVREEALFK